MFTGIVETLGTVREITPNDSNLTVWIESSISPELTVDQSLNHDGICLTVEETRDGLHRITAVKETLKKTNLRHWQPGYFVNLERSLLLNSRLDGHLVQGHVDSTGICLKRKEKDGAREFIFSFPAKYAKLVIEKGSISINGISLTVFNVKKDRFTVAIVPYTFDQTNIRLVEKGSIINLEFDMIGKYIQRWSGK